MKLDTLKLDLVSGLEVLKTEAPAQRQGGVKVETVDDLLAKLRNEAKVL